MNRKELIIVIWILGFLSLLFLVAAVVNIQKLHNIKETIAEKDLGVVKQLGIVYMKLPKDLNGSLDNIEIYAQAQKGDEVRQAVLR